MADADLAELMLRIAALEHDLGVQQDIHAVRRLQYAYGYFLDKSQYQEVVDLFSAMGEVWFMGGVYKQAAGIRRLYLERFRARFTDGHNGPRYGWLIDHPQLQMIIDVAPGRNTALARGRSIMQAGLHQTAKGQQRQWWEGGIYENEYVREDGVWKIMAIRYHPFWHAAFNDGWAKTPVDYIASASRLFPEDPLGPDELIEPQPRLWPATDTVPYHYVHPVTGKPIAIDNSRAREGFSV